MWDTGLLWAFVLLLDAYNPTITGVNFGWEVYMSMHNWGLTPNSWGQHPGLHIWMEFDICSADTKAKPVPPKPEPPMLEFVMGWRDLPLRWTMPDIAMFYEIFDIKHAWARTRWGLSPEAIDVLTRMRRMPKLK